jgi:hypothetical protein
MIWEAICGSVRRGPSIGIVQWIGMRREVRGRVLVLADPEGR